MSRTPRTDAGTITVKVGSETWVVCRLDVAAQLELDLVEAHADRDMWRELFVKRIEEDAR